MAKFVPDKAVAEAKRNTALETLEAGVAAIQTSEDFQRFLKAQACFHRYSFGNTLLIISQRPDATRVAGFKTWLKLGRHVLKGSKGITIFVPMARKYTVEGDDGEDVQKSRLFFGTGSVFDVSDTDGEPLPVGPEYIKIDGDSHGDLYDAVAAVVTAKGITITQEPGGHKTAHGFFNPLTNAIWISPDLSPNAKAGTLIHELAHASDETLKLETYSEHRGEAETLAEGVAFVVASHFGLDTGSSSFVYVAKWAEKPEVLKAKLTAIQKVAAGIIDAIEAVGAAAPAVVQEAIAA